MKTKFFLSFIGFLLAFTAVKFTIGIYYEAYEGLWAPAISGQLTDGVPWDSFFYMALIFTGKLISGLYGISPTLPWYDIILLNLLALAMAFAFSALLYRLQKSSVADIAKILAFPILLIVGLDCIIHVQITRVSILLAAAPLFYFAFVIEDSHSYRFEKTFFYAVSVILFIVGFSLRTESAIYILIITVLYVCLFKPLNLRILLSFLPQMIVLVCFGVYIIFLVSDPDCHYARTEAGIEYQIGQGNVVDIGTMKTAEDSAKYIAAINGIFIDPDKLNIEFLKSIIDTDKSFKISPRLRRGYRLLMANAEFYLLDIVLNILILLLLLLVSGLPSMRWFRIVLFNLAIVVSLFVLAGLLKLELRVVGPVLFITTLVNSGFLFSTIKRNKAIFTGFNKGIVSTFLIVAVLISCRNYKETVKYRKAIAINVKMFNQLRDLARNKLLVPDFNVFNSMFFNNALPFEIPDFSSFKQVYQMDIAAWSLMPVYRRYLDKHCHCDSRNLGDFFEYLRKNKSEVVIAGNPKRILLFQKYINVVHRKNLKFIANDTIWADDTPFILDGLSKSYTTFTIE